MSRSETATSDWLRSTACEAGACAEVKFGADEIFLRSSVNPAEIIRLTVEEWRAFCAGIAAGEFDR